MIHAVIEEAQIAFTADDSTRTAVLTFRDHPGVFDHPRHPFPHPDKASEIIRPVLRSFCRLLPPKVTFCIARELAGGVTEVDLRAIKEAFIHAGARDVIFDGRA
jgi:hypothetical protein